MHKIEKTARRTGGYTVLACNVHVEIGRLKEEIVVGMCDDIF